MIQFKINEAQTFQFDMEIDGKIKSVESVSFVIESGSGYDIKVPAIYNSGHRLIECDIPILEGILTDGEKNIRLEMVVDGKFYTPLHDKIIIETPVRIVSKMIGELVKEDEISVRIVSKMVSTSELASKTIEDKLPVLEEKILIEKPASEPASEPASNMISTPIDEVKEIKKDKSLAFSLWMNSPV